MIIVFQIVEWLPGKKESGLFYMVTRVRAKTSGWQLCRNRSGLIISPGTEMIIVMNSLSWFRVYNNWIFYHNKPDCNHTLHPSSIGIKPY
jgi:hypothetical protein